MPEYVEYLEKIEALVAVINHRHGTTDWMPIDLRLRDDFEEAVALYKHYDLLLVNAMWDGMNLVSKEGPLVNTRDGMIVLSENTGAHEELGECALSVNPFDVQEQADAMYHAPDGLARGAPAAHGDAAPRSSPRARPADWIDEQLADIDEKRAAAAGGGAAVTGLRKDAGRSHWPWDAGPGAARAVRLRRAAGGGAGRAAEAACRGCRRVPASGGAGARSAVVAGAALGAGRDGAGVRRARRAARAGRRLARGRPRRRRRRGAGWTPRRAAPPPGGRRPPRAAAARARAARPRPARTRARDVRPADPAHGSA